MTKPLTIEEAKAIPLPGWNLRCNRCGSFGATHEDGDGKRRGYGHFVFCPSCMKEYVAMQERHRLEAEVWQTIHFEQDWRRDS
jgi:hypothetical protein